MADAKKAEKKKQFKAYEQRKECAKCGARMARHSDRVTCGKCGYTEFVKSEPAAQPKPKK